MANPTPSELEILDILWELEEGTAQDVNSRLNKTSYTGTLKLMQLMHQKGILNRRREGRSHVYFPAIQEDETRNSLLDRFINSTFGGSAGRLMVQLLGNQSVSKEERDKIREFLKEMERDEK